MRDFIAQLEQQGELKRVAVEADRRPEKTEVCDRVFKADGSAIPFEKPKGYDGTTGRARNPVLTFRRTPKAWNETSSSFAWLAAEVETQRRATQCDETTLPSKALK